MDNELKVKWVDALRSGNYVQGQQALCNGGNFCCLGVLCEVAGVPSFGGKEQYSSYIYYQIDSSRYASTSLDAGDFDLTQSQINKLIEMNDGDGVIDGCEEPIKRYSFIEIADYIEKNL